MIRAGTDIFNARILIVDDQSSNAPLLKQLLAQAGYNRVSSATNPHQVCELHCKHQYDLLLLDLQRPDVEGFQLMETLKTESTDKHLPVIMVTEQPVNKVHALAAGVRDFISKPFDVIEVKTRITNMLEVRLLYKKLEEYSQSLESIIEERTADLRASEARYRSLIELASDWYWEQDETGRFTKVSGPVLDMLGVKLNSPDEAVAETEGWNTAEREHLQASIAARQPFIDFPFSRTYPDGSQQHYRVSGEPMFDQSCQFVGYRGIGVECKSKVDNNAINHSTVNQ